MKNLVIILLFLLVSCTSENTNSEVREIYYFDLKTYFTEEAEKLSQQKQLVNKSITHNDSVEEKQMQINNWTEELALFIESDINKTSWKDSYKKDSTSNKITYTAKEDNLKTQSVEIEFSENKPSKFKIINKTHNYLYKTDEILEYIPGSSYLINKKQQVTLLGENDYLIQGLFH
jgi:hypothetical protein